MAIINHFFNFSKQYRSANFIDYENNEYNVYLDILNYVINNSAKIHSDKENDRINKLKNISEYISYVQFKNDGEIKVMSFERDHSCEYENLRIRFEKIFLEVALRDSWAKFVHDNKKLGHDDKEIIKKADEIYTKTIMLLGIVKENKEDYKKGTINSEEPEVIARIRRIVLEILISEDRKDAGEKFKRLEAVYNILNEYFSYNFPYYQTKKELPKELLESIINKYNACKLKDAERNEKMNMRVEAIKEYVSSNDEIDEKVIEKIQNKSLSELVADKEAKIQKELKQKLLEKKKQEANKKNQEDLQENLIEYLNNDAK